jgi:hypothetical protein
MRCAYLRRAKKGVKERVVAKEEAQRRRKNIYLLSRVFIPPAGISQYV